MGVRTTDGEGKVALFDSVSGFAFGPVFDDTDDAESFLAWLAQFRPQTDPRSMTDDDLRDQHRAWDEAGEHE